MDWKKIKKNSLVALVVVALLVGWKFPLLGFIVPIVMVTAIAVSFFRGRFHCGNICPRGFFLDSFLYKFSPRKSIPPFFKNIYFRIGVVIFMMGSMTFMISRDPGNIMHWGMVFWRMCFWTTMVGLLLGFIYRPRTWCAFCPMGTMQKLNWRKGKKLALKEDSCKTCMLCEKACPLNLSIIDKKDKTVQHNKDCISCSKCVVSCPSSSLDYECKRSA